MFIVVTRSPRPDAPNWPGRVPLAAIDAVAWPLVWIWLFRHAPAPQGLVGPTVTAIAVLCAVLRLQRAVWLNHRYWFTTWRWGKVAASLLLIGLVLKMAVTA